MSTPLSPAQRRELREALQLVGYWYQCTSDERDTMHAIAWEAPAPALDTYCLLAAEIHRELVWS